MKFSEQVELFINTLEAGEVELVEGVALDLVREKWLPIIRKFEGEPCSVCGTQPALLVDAKEKGTYWMCADCMFETIKDKMKLEKKIQRLSVANTLVFVDYLDTHYKDDPWLGALSRTLKAYAEGGDNAS